MTDRVTWHRGLGVMTLAERTLVPTRQQAAFLDMLTAVPGKVLRVEDQTETLGGIACVGQWALADHRKRLRAAMRDKLGDDSALEHTHNVGTRWTGDVNAETDAVRRVLRTVGTAGVLQIAWTDNGALMLIDIPTDGPPVVRKLADTWPPEGGNLRMERPSGSGRFMTLWIKPPTKGQSPT